MPTIKIDEEVWSALQAEATPLVDTPNTVLRKKFGLSDKTEGKRENAPGGRSPNSRAKGRTPQIAFRRPILEALYAAGGAKAVNEILDDIERDLGGQLNDVDRSLLNSGRDIRWKNAAQWERAVMVEEGILKSDSPRGIWELTDKGIRIAQDEPNMSSSKTGSGQEYNEKWNVGAKQAFFHKDGTFYMPLNKFPGAFFDPYGYVLFETEREYFDCAEVFQAEGPRANIPKGIKTLATYIRRL